MKFFEVIKEGVKLRHRSWDKDEYIELNNNILKYNNGNIVEIVTNIHSDGWELYELKKISDLRYGTTFEYLNHKYTKVELCIAVQNAIGNDKRCAMHIDNQIIAIFHGDVQVKPL